MGKLVLDLLEAPVLYTVRLGGRQESTLVQVLWGRGAHVVTVYNVAFLYECGYSFDQVQVLPMQLFFWGLFY